MTQDNYIKRKIELVCRALNIPSLEHLKEQELDDLTDILDQIYEDGFYDAENNQ